MFAGTQPLLLAEARERGPEQFLKEAAGRCWLASDKVDRLGRFGDADVHQTAQTTGEAVVMSPREPAPQLAKEHVCQFASSR
jgi:hypothetical protein